MSKEMKDFLSQFISQPEIKPNTELEKKVKPIKEKTTKTEKKPAAKTLVNIEHTEGVEWLSVEAFLATVNDKKFVFEKKKNLQIDDRLFTILTLLKQHEGIKSIANLLNALVEKYINDNKDELKSILSKNPLNNF